MYIKLSELWLFKDIECLKTIGELQLIAHIKLISDEIDEYCNTRFEPTDDKYSRDLVEVFNTRRQPLLEVKKLALHGLRLSENRNFFVYTENARIEVTPTTTKHYKKALEIEYLFGYEKVPATVKQVIVDLLKLDLEAKVASSLGMQSENFDGEYSYARQASKDFTPAELRKNILARLDIFKVEPFVELKSKREVKVRVI